LSLRALHTRRSAGTGSMRSTIFSASVIAVASHGILMIPPSRNLDDFHAGWPGINQPKPVQWFSVGCNSLNETLCKGAFIPGEPTNCDLDMLGAPHGWGGCDQPNDECIAYHCPFNGTVFSPWFAPGTAPVESPCGLWHTFVNAPSNGDGRDLPGTERPLWRAGSEVEVAWHLFVNHFGGYSYRLCPAEREQTEECFQQHHLQFAGSETVIRWTNGTESSIPATTFTTPGGDSWRRVPVPWGSGGGPWNSFPAPCPGCASGYGSQPFVMVDRVVLPSALAAGNYTLSWRWDCIQNPQIWSNCADVEVEVASTVL